MRRQYWIGMAFLALFTLFGLFSACEFSDQGTPTDGDSPADGDGSVHPPDGDADYEIDRQESEVVMVVEPASWVSEDNKAPRFLHLTYQHDPRDSITVQWQTEFTDVDRYTPKVWFVKEDDLLEGEMPFATHYQQAGTSFTYETKLRDPDTNDQYTARLAVHEVEIRGLEAGTKYHFRAGTWNDFDMEIGEFSAPNLSDALTFKTAVSRDPNASFSFVMAGDSRGGYNGINDNIDRLTGIGADFWIFNGDMNDIGTQNEWFLWFEAMDPILKETPLMPVQGNHEFFSEELYYYSFALPEEKGLPEGYEEHAWHFVYGNTLVIGLDSNAFNPPEQIVMDQVPWLESILEKYKDDPNIVWRIAMTHHPVYSACSTHGSTDRLIEHFVPVFEKYGVDMAYAGHDHDYERSWPWKNGKKQNEGEGVVYLVAGGFYSPGYSAGEDVWTRFSKDGKDSNYVVSEVNGRTMKITAYNGVGDKFDEYTLTK